MLQISLENTYLHSPYRTQPMSLLRAFGPFYSTQEGNIPVPPRFPAGFVLVLDETVALAGSHEARLETHSGRFSPPAVSSASALSLLPGISVSSQDQLSKSFVICVGRSSDLESNGLYGLIAKVIIL